MPWRIPERSGTFSAYKILVSEVMLQQTQVPRVIPKYQAFLQEFPTVQALAKAPLATVLTAWSGLGYNRRAMYLHEAAKQLKSKPIWSYEDLIACKGIGPNTANAVLVYIYNMPLLFIETNIRTVFIHYFFNDSQVVTDAQMLDLHSATIDKQMPRVWYWSLMDIGSYIKAQHGNKSTKSSSYKKQSPFKGSVRQLRGQVLKNLQQSSLQESQLSQLVTDDRLHDVLIKLESEHLINQYKGSYYLGKNTNTK